MRSYGLQILLVGMGLLPTLTPASGADGAPWRWYQYCVEASKAAGAPAHPGHGRGRYEVEYQGGPHGRTLVHARARFEAWFTDTQCRVDLRYDVNHDRFPRALLLRAGNLHVSHRFRPTPESQPFVVTTGIYSPDTRPVLHGLLVDPAAPHLLMLDVRNFAKQTLRCFPTAGNLWEVRVTSSTQPDVLAAVIEIDPRRGCLPSRSQIYDGAGALVQETTYEWERVSGRWFCRRFETVNHGQVALNGEAFGRRVCRLVYDELELDITADPKLFQMESLEIPPGTAIADLRKDALDPYLVYKPESDPRQQELDRMVEQAGRMIVTTAAEGLAQSRWLLAAFTAAGLLGISALLYIARRVNVRRRLASPPGAGRAS